MLLGEISYAVYLTHWTLLAYYYAALVLAGSYALWRFVEVPCRRILVGGRPRPRPVEPPAAVREPTG